MGFVYPKGTGVRRFASHCMTAIRALKKSFGRRCHHRDDGQLKKGDSYIVAGILEKSDGKTLLLLKPRGFCAGVVRAIDVVLFDHKAVVDNFLAHIDRRYKGFQGK